MPIFSLPSPYGIGTMGQAARDFLDFLKAGGQSYWQLLPIGPTSYGDSPYQSFSSFAGNPYFIDLDDLAADGLLKPSEYQALDWGADAQSVDYALLYQTRWPVLRLAVKRLLAEPPADYEAFLADNGDWLDNYALFMAIKGENGGVSWQEWPEGCACAGRRTWPPPGPDWRSSWTSGGAYSTCFPAVGRAEGAGPGA